MPETSTPPADHVFLTTDAVGGVWQYALDLARIYRSHGMEVTLAVLGPAAPEDKRAEARLVPGLDVIETGLPLEWMTDSADDLSHAALRLSRLAGQTGADIVHLNNPALAAGGDWETPLVATLHSCVATWWQTMRPDEEMPEDFRWRTDAIARGLARADRVIAPSAAFARAAQRVYRGIRFEVVHNGRDDTAFGSLGLPREGIITSGRLWDEAKNARVLDLAARRLDLPVWAAGPLEGPHGVAQLYPHLKLLGAVPNVKLRRYLAESSIFVSTALYEPFGLGVLEAAQTGCALVLSDIATFRELWEGAAIFVDPHDPEAVAHALLALSTAENTRERLSAAAQERAAQYTAARMALRTLSVYAQATASLGRRGAA